MSLKVLITVLNVKMSKIIKSSISAYREYALTVCNNTTSRYRANTKTGEVNRTRERLNDFRQHHALHKLFQEFMTRCVKDDNLT